VRTTAASPGLKQQPPDRLRPGQNRPLHVSESHWYVYSNRRPHRHFRNLPNVPINYDSRPNHYRLRSRIHLRFRQARSTSLAHMESRSSAPSSYAFESAAPPSPMKGKRHWRPTTTVFRYRSATKENVAIAHRTYTVVHISLRRTHVVSRMNV
jgi:hypothetical protein